MKKPLPLLLAAALITGVLGGAHAQAPASTLAGLRSETAQGWHETYQAYGRTIAVDIPVQVPEADAIPALTAEALPLSPTLSDTSAMSEGCDTHDHLYHNEPGFFRLDTPSRAALHAFLRQRTAQDPPPGFDTPPVIVRYNDLDWDTAYSYNLSATLRDADQLMKSVLDAYFPAQGVVLSPHWVHARDGCRRYDQQTGVFSGERWEGTRVPLIVYFNQVLNGIPILTSAAEAFGRYADTQAPQGESVHFGGIGIIQDEGMPQWYTSAQFNHMLRVRDVLAQEVPLCSFATLRASCEQLIAQGRLRAVDSLRLGYAAWYGQSGGYTLMPVWVLEGELFETAATERRERVTEATGTTAEYGSLLFDAQTGAFLDPWATPTARAYQAPKLVK